MQTIILIVGMVLFAVGFALARRRYRFRREHEGAQAHIGRKP